MSKRHQSSRRRAYGRRQHEIHERTSRRSIGLDLPFDLAPWAQPDDRYTDLEVEVAGRYRFALDG
ncbi:MAG TPA: hypothetical protein VFR93_05865 [Candidatus Limnocylindrales bacterium]|nr:hypothetical protein [Candidatus Limnocylindrales bacterium]